MKKIISYILIFVTCLTLVGCEGKKTYNVPNELSKDLIEVEFWHAMGESKQNLIAKIIDNFEREYQEKGYNIKVIQKSFGSYNDLKDEINDPLGNIPTVAQTYPDHVSLYLAGDIVRELDPYNESKWGLGDDRIQYVDGFFSDGKNYENGYLYSLPFIKSMEVLYYNKTMFEQYGWEVPKTWDEVIKISEEFKQTYEYYRLTQAGMPAAGFSYSLESNLFITLTKQWGGEYTGFKNSTGGGSQLGGGWVLFNNEKSKEAMKFYYDNFKAGNMATSSFFGSSTSYNAFKAGQCIMMVDSGMNANHSNGEFEVGVAPCPQKDLNNPQVIQQGTNLTLFKCKDRQEELAGWLFMKYLTNYESTLILATGFDEYTNLAGELIEGEEGTSYFPIRKDVLNSEKYRNYIDYDLENLESWSLDKEVAKVYLEQLDWLITNLAFDGSAIIYNEVDDLVRKLLYTDHSGKDLNVVIDELYSEIIYTIIYG